MRSASSDTSSIAAQQPTAAEKANANRSGEPYDHIRRVTATERRHLLNLRQRRHPEWKNATA